MSVWKKLITAVKGHANNAAEAAQDANLTVILDQEVREAEQSIGKAREEKAKMVGRKKMKAKAVEEAETEVGRLMTAARNAKQQGDEDLAKQILERVIKLKERSGEDQRLLEQYVKTEERMDVSIKESVRKIEKLKIKIESVKASESLIKAQKASSTSALISDGKLAGAVESLDRLEKRQAEQQAMLEAADEDARQMDGSDLDARIRAMENPGQSDVNAMLKDL